MVVLFLVAFLLTGLGRSCQPWALPGTFLAIVYTLVLQQLLFVRGFQTTSCKPWVAGLAMRISCISAHRLNLWRPFLRRFHERICLFLGPVESHYFSVVHQRVVGLSGVASQAAFFRGLFSFLRGLSGLGLGPHGVWGGLGENWRFPVTSVRGLLLSPSTRFPLAGLPWVPPCCA